jgi:hypothetical protein
VTYRIYRGAWDSTTLLTTTNSLSYNDTSTTTWTYYFYRVAAVNSAGQGPYTPNQGGQKTA